MNVVWEQVFILFIFVMIGFLLAKKKLVSLEQAKILSALAVYVFLPCRVFKSFSNVNLTYLKENWENVVISIVILLSIAVLFHFVVKLFSKKKYEQSIYEYSLTVGNFGYMGYALAGSLFGETVLADMMFFALPLNVYSYSYAFGMLTKSKFNLKMLLKPTIIAIILGLTVGITGIKLPTIITDTVDFSAACMSPNVMILTGIVIAGYSLKAIFGQKVIYITILLRLIVIPCILGLLINWIYPSILIPVLLCYSMPVGMNTILFPRLVGENCEIGAGLVSMSTVISCFTIPLVFMLFT